MQAKISAEQGIFRLNEIKPVIGIQNNVRFKDVLDQVIVFGWTPANTPAGVGDKSFLDINAYFADLSAIRSCAHGVNTFPVIGDGWSEDTTAAAILKEILEVERGYFFIDRTGKIMFYDRHTYQSGGFGLLLESISIDAKANAAKYSYGDKVFNVIKVSYYPKKYTNESVWKTKTPIVVARKKIRNVDIKLEYPEGSDITVSALDIAASTIAAKTKAGTTVASNNYSVSATLQNSAAVLSISNRSGQPLYFTIDLFGTVVTSFGSQTYYAQLADYSTNYESYQDEGKREKAFSNKLITTEDEATAIGDMRCFPLRPVRRAKGDDTTCACRARLLLAKTAPQASAHGRRRDP